VKSHFVRTENLEALERGVHMLEERGAREASWMLVTGRPGEGKTTTLYNWGASVGAAFVTMRQGWSPGRMVAALASKLGLPSTTDMDETLGERLAQSDTPIVLDEAQFALPNNAACLERLRGITDKTGTPVMLVVMERDVWRFSQREQISSRIFNWVEFKPATLADVGTACQQLTDVRIKADLVTRLHADTRGCMRDVLNGIARIEMAAKGLNKDEVGAADMKRVTLCEDYRKAHDATMARARSGARSA
jgi:hypothetical protein